MDALSSKSKFSCSEGEIKDYISLSINIYIYNLGKYLDYRNWSQKVHGPNYSSESKGTNPRK